MAKFQFRTINGAMMIPSKLQSGAYLFLVYFGVLAFGFWAVRSKFDFVLIMQWPEKCDQRTMAE